MHPTGRPILSRRPLWLRALTLGLLGLLLIGGLPLVSTPAAQAESAPPVHLLAAWSQGYADNLYVPGEILVGIASPAGQMGPESGRLRPDLMALVGASVEKAAVLPPLAAQEWAAASGMALAASQAESTVHVQLWQVAPGGEVAALSRLLAQPQVIFAEPNGLVWAAETPTPVTPTDPLYDSAQWSMQRISASRAWTLSTGALAAGGGLRVAVIDSGIDLGHPEFAGRIVYSKNYVNPGTPAQDDNGHGTHVAGIIAAAQNNGLGITGLAPDVELDIRRVLSNGPGGLTGTIDNLANAIFEAADAGAQVINLSVATSVTSTVLSSAISLANVRGALLVAAAGNTGGPVQWPAAYANVMAVAATDRFDRHAFYSNQGPEIDLAAPGGLVQASTIPPINQPILSTWAAGTFCNQVYQPQSGYCSSTGTSMATAFVSGAAALIRSLRPDLSATQVRQILTESAVPLGDGVQKIGQGRLDAQAALRRAVLRDLRFVPGGVALILPPAHPVTQNVSVAVTNPSTDPVTWQIASISVPWLTATGPTAGSTAYGRPGQISLVISPTGLLTGTHTGRVNVTVTPSTGPAFSRSLDVVVLANAAPQQSYLPLVLAQQMGGSVPGFVWESPGAAAPITLTMFAGSSNGLQLPFTMLVKEEAYGYARLSASGLLFLQKDPGESLGAVSPNRCLSTINGTDWLHKGIAGWWADLDPSRGGAVRTFQPDGVTRYVIEFADVATAAGVTPAYTVSFQMVLYPNGNVGLNYRETPAHPGAVTVGMVARDGLIYNQIGCITVGGRLGEAPRSGTSILITGNGLY